MLCESERSPTSGATQNLITFREVGTTVGSFATEQITLTDDGPIATNSNSDGPEKLAARFRLAIEHLAAFKGVVRGVRGQTACCSP